MKVKSYTAYENIERFSPVFLFYDNSKKENYVYSSHNLTQLDKGNPVCIGVCINDVIRNGIAKVVISGVTNIRYYGDLPSKNTAVYCLKKYNNEEKHGFVSYIADNVELLTYEKSHIIKLGIIYPSTLYNDDKLPKNAFVPRILKISLGIDNENFDHHNSHALDELPQNKIENGLFSMYEIGNLLKTGMQSQDAVGAFNTLINNNVQNASKNLMCNHINNYCERVYYNIPFITTPGAEEYVKRLSVTMSSGQVVFDTENNLRIVDHKTNGVLTSIPLLSNPFNTASFDLVDSIVNSHLYPYVDNSDTTINGVIGSYYFSPSTGVYDNIKNTVNGISFGSRYCPIVDTYSYDVSYFNGMTNNFNKHDSDGLNVRLSWYKNPVLAALLRAVYNNYTIINDINSSAKINTQTITENTQTITKNKEHTNTLKTQVEQELLNKNLKNAVALQNQINTLQQTTHALLQSNETLNNAINNDQTTSSNTITQIETVENEDYIYHVKKYVDDAKQENTEVNTLKSTANSSYDTSVVESGLLDDYKTSVDTLITNYVNTLNPGTGSGNGTGTGTGSGSGDGSGDGTGTGSGSGDGSGDGTGTGSGSDFQVAFLNFGFSTTSNSQVAMNDYYIACSDTQYDANTGKVYIYNKSTGDIKVIQDPNYGLRSSYFGKTLGFLWSHILYVGSKEIIFEYKLDWSTQTWSLNQEFPARGTELFFGYASSDQNGMIAARYGNYVDVYKLDNLGSSEVTFLQTIDGTIGTHGLTGISFYNDILVIASRTTLSVQVYRYNNKTNLMELRTTLTGFSSCESVALFYDTIAVGSPFEKIDGINNVGKVYIYKSNDEGLTWSATPSYIIPSPLVTFGNAFGIGVWAYNNSLVISSKHASSGDATGVVYVYTFNNDTWSLSHTLKSEIPVSQSSFGSVMTVNSTDILINNLYSSKSQHKYVYWYKNIIAQHENGFAPGYFTRRIVGDWVNNHSYMLSGEIPFKQLKSLKMNSEYIVASAAVDVNNSYGVYVFDRNNNNSATLLNYPEQSSTTSFGNCVGISPNNTVVISSAEYNESFVYVYKIMNGSWTVVHKIVVDGYENVNLMDIDVNDTIVIVYYEAIVVYMFDGTGWNNIYNIPRSGTPLQATSSYKSQLSIYDNVFVLGVGLADNNRGAAWVFTFSNDTWEYQALTINEDTERLSFGRDASIYKDIIAVASDTSNYPNIVTGSIYIYKSPDNGVTWPSMPTTILNQDTFPDYVPVDYTKFNGYVRAYNNVIIAHSYYDLLYVFTTNDEGLTWNISHTITIGKSDVHEGSAYNTIFSGGFESNILTLYGTDFSFYARVYPSDSFNYEEREYKIVMYENIGLPGGSDSY